MSEFQGVIVSAVTPRGKHGDIDFGAAFELVDHCCRAGVEGILLFGEEGEYAAFSPGERSRLLHLAVKRSRVPVLAGAGSPDLAVSATLAREASDAGVAAVLAPPPLFQRPDTDDLAEYYAQLAVQSGVRNLMLYNVPATTAGIPVETALMLLETDTVAGIDEAGDAASFERLSAAACNRAFELLAGRDSLFFEARRRGHAVVSAVACAVPELLVALHRDPDDERLRLRFEEFLGWTERLPNMVGVKTALELRGLKTGPLPIPLSPGKQRLLNEFRDWFQAWLPSAKGKSAC
jgi:dihydrodipicolinate synthase/N-acetylneuraminate lyase